MKAAIATRPVATSAKAAHDDERATDVDGLFTASRYNIAPFSRMLADRESRFFAILFVALTFVMGAAWGGVVPPFEAPDESAFYQSLTQYAFEGAPVNMRLYGAIMTQIV